MVFEEITSIEILAALPLRLALGTAFVVHGITETVTRSINGEVK